MPALPFPDTDSDDDLVDDLPRVPAFTMRELCFGIYGEAPLGAKAY